MQVIEQYSFGNITIKGKTYSNDLILLPDEIFPSWWRKEGHNLHLEDLKEVLNRKLDVLIIGTGYNGIMKVNQDLTSQLENMGLNIIVEKSREAVNKYNALLKEGRKVALAIHLTC
jgi:hypothetical protein